MKLELTQEELNIVIFAMSARIDDYEKEIIKQEKKSGEKLDTARDLHSAMEKFYLTRINPACKCGTVTLLNGEKI